jgi:hypothetical protein
MASMPSPVLQLLSSTGRPRRTSFASFTIKSTLAPTKGARSVLLMTSRSERMMPRSRLRGMSSPPAVSITNSQ